jgi:hypothetical protein
VKQFAPWVSRSDMTNSEDRSGATFMVGCDFHTPFQQVAMLDPNIGEVLKRRLEHESGEAEKIYGTLEGTLGWVSKRRSVHLFERPLHRYRDKLWIGNAAEILRRGCERRRPMCAMPCTSWICFSPRFRRGTRNLIPVDDKSKCYFAKPANRSNRLHVIGTGGAHAPADSVYCVRSAHATPAVGVQLNFSKAVNTPPTRFHRFLLPLIASRRWAHLR